ncbi:unnamed protein product [Symbiodinium necroappetens]|uniref:Uncharacterized protein n=1 Tax=Symbiodinium necroappetens TaxID=1628268 RepID=A0A812UPU1_9DINO|nr:unnamed protein product [Symbiodinium necroappetens]
MEAVGNIMLSLHRNLQEIQTSLDGRGQSREHELLSGTCSSSCDSQLAASGDQVAPLPPAAPAAPPLSTLAPPSRQAQIAVAWVQRHRLMELWATKSPVVRMTAVGEIEVPIAANGTLQKAALARLARAAEEEMPQALSLQIRLSLLYTPLGGRPELYGYSFSGARLRVQRVQCRLASNASEGMVVVHAIAEPPSLFFFRSAVASKEVQVLAEVLAFEDAPKKPAVGSTVPASRIWKLAVPVAKAKPQPKAQAKAKAKLGNGSSTANPEQLQTQLDQPFKPLGPSPGGRAESAWPLSGGTYPTPLYADPPPECVLAWALLRFDLATESRSPLKAELRPGKLREHLAKNLPGKSTAAAEAELSRLFAATFKAKQPPLLECDVQVIPLDDAPRRLLPRDFPAVTESHRMGGLEVIEDVSGLQIEGALSANALDPDVTVRGILVTLPDAGWMESFLRSVPQPPQMPGVSEPESIGFSDRGAPIQENKSKHIRKTSRIDLENSK